MSYAELRASEGRRARTATRVGEHRRQRCSTPDTRVNGTGQVDVRVADVGHEHSDAFADRPPLRGRGRRRRSSRREQRRDLRTTTSTLDDRTCTTGNAVASQRALDGEVERSRQTNTTPADVVTLGFGDGVSAIHQSNAASITADDNTALANSGGNVQGSGGQLNLDRSARARAGAGGSPALASDASALGLAVAGTRPRPPATRAVRASDLTATTR